MTTLTVRNSINRSSVRCSLLLTRMVLSFGLLTLARTSHAVSPPPHGNYGIGNTAEGQHALFSLGTDGSFNIAIGFDALYHCTIGNENTAIGDRHSLVLPPASTTRLLVPVHSLSTAPVPTTQRSVGLRFTITPPVATPLRVTAHFRTIPLATKTPRTALAHF